MLGVILNEYGEYDTTATILSDAACAALGAVIAKTRHLSDLKSIRKVILLQSCADHGLLLRNLVFY